MRHWMYAFALCAVSASAVAAPEAESIGSPNRGRLEGAVTPTNSGTLQVLPGYVAQGVAWGHPELVELLERASRSVSKKFPGSVLGLGGLSRKRGGDVGGHASHESGRDADVAFYRSTSRGKALGPMRFARINRQGFAGDGTTFDLPRNWAFVEALLSDNRTRVSHIFVVKHLRTRLLAEAVRAGASERVRERAEEVLQQPAHAQPHDDHFHVRIACPEGSDRCVEVAEAPRVVARARARVAHKAPVVPTREASPSTAQAQTAAPRVVPKREAAPSAPARFGAPLVKPLQRVQANESTSPLLDLIGPRVEGLDSAAMVSPK